MNNNLFVECTQNLIDPRQVTIQMKIAEFLAMTLIDNGELFKTCENLEVNTISYSKGCCLLNDARLAFTAFTKMKSERF